MSGTNPIRIEVSGEAAIADGPFPFAFVRMIAALSGRKIWNGSKSVKLLATPANIKILKSSEFEIEWIDKVGSMAAQVELESLATQFTIAPTPTLPYAPRVELYAHQSLALNLSWERAAYALLFEMGLGKTAILIATAGMLFRAGRLTGVLVLAPNGVHEQWVEDEIPKHLDSSIKPQFVRWKKKLIHPENMKTRGLTFFSMNIESIRTNNGTQSAWNFLRLHSSKSMMIIDESHTIKSMSSSRTRAVEELRDCATYRRIATGTPLAKNILDTLPQFNFLDPRILGYKYASAFKARYCILSNDGERRIVGQKNTEEFYNLIAPHSFRMTKKEALDLPEKIPVVREYEMSEETLHHYNSMKKEFTTKMNNGEIVDAPNAAVAMLRLHQIACGHLPLAEGGVQRIGGERLEALIEIIKQVEGPVIIWSRFIEDGVGISEKLFAAGNSGDFSFAVYRGGDDAKKAAKAAFLEGRARILVANPSAGGTGLNLQGACQNVIYFSNSFNSLHRWQSEDRTHRIGMHGAVTYFDLVARGSVDRAILRNLKQKKSISDLTFDEIRQSIASA